MNFNLNAWQLKRRETAAEQSLLNQNKRRPWLRSVNEFNGGCGVTGIGGVLTSSNHRFLSLNRWSDFRGLYLGLRKFLNSVEPLLEGIGKENEARVGIKPTSQFPHLLIL